MAQVSEGLIHRQDDRSDDSTGFLAAQGLDHQDGQLDGSIVALALVVLK